MRKGCATASSGVPMATVLKCGSSMDELRAEEGLTNAISRACEV
jgi:hypothetical protein